MVARELDMFALDKTWFEIGKKAFLHEYTLPDKANLLTDIGLLYGYDFKKHFVQAVKWVTWEEIKKIY